MQEGLPVERVRSSGVTVALHPNPETWRVRIWKSPLARSKKICSFEWTSPSGAHSKWGPHSSVPTFIRVWCARHVCSWTFVFSFLRRCSILVFNRGLPLYLLRPSPISMFFPLCTVAFQYSSIIVTLFKEVSLPPVFHVIQIYIAATIERLLHNHQLSTLFCSLCHWV